MPAIDVDQATWEKLQLTASLTDQPLGSVVRMLVDRIATADRPVSRSTSEPTSDGAQVNSRSGWIAIHKVFKGHRVEGQFNPSTLAVRIDTPPWSRKEFPSPSSSAIAVVEHFSGDRVSSNTNGRKFWKVTGTGRDLRSIVGTR